MNTKQAITGCITAFNLEKEETLFLHHINSHTELFTIYWHFICMAFMQTGH